MRLLSQILNILTIIFAYFSFLFSAFVCFLIIRKKVINKKIKIIEWIELLIALIYSVGFLICRIFFPSVFELFFGVIVVVLLVIGTCFSKYEDRKNGKRWWNW